MIEMKCLVLFLTFNVFVEPSSWSLRMNNVLRGNHLPINMAMKKNLGWGLQLAVEHCQRQFKWDPWNCPTNVFSYGNRGWGSTRESAYVMAITSAAIDYSVTKNCSMGNIKRCGCNPYINGKIENNFIWGGCSDFPNYGEKVSRKYLDDAETGTDAHTFVNLHNFEIGRDVLRKTMKKNCKCHGMSGSCTLQSCWMQMAPFEEIAAQLRTRYDKAVRFDFEGEGPNAVGNSVIGNSLEGIPKSNTKNLIYLQNSPNYCRENKTMGWKGTRGRTCSRRKEKDVTIPEKRSCRNLCKKCNYAVKKKAHVVEKHCNCSFQWCCKVQCEKCKESVVEHFCS